MGKHIIKFYPVANGDTTLLKLNDGTTIIVDCKIREGDEDDHGNEIFDVKADLLENLSKKDGIYHADLFVLSHQDLDHCLGAEKNFYLGDPKDYADTNKENNEIILNDLWVTSSLFNNADNSDAKALKKEAERRKKLWDENSSSKDEDGNRLRLIGYDGDERFDSVPNTVPGESIELIDISGSDAETFEIFIHAPFKKSLIESQATKDKNSTSIVFQARFKDSSNDEDWSTYFLTGGDADHYIWEQVLNKSKDNDNEDKLLWDIFLAPHHCSWSFFNNTPYEDEENREPMDYSLEVLDYGRKDAYIVTSSRKIKNGKPNPPHSEAKKQYKKKVKEENFLNTAINSSEKKPIPIVFEIEKDSVERVDEGKEKSLKMAAAASIASTSIVSGDWASNERF